MSDLVTTSTISTVNPPVNETMLPSVTIASSPDSYSFQHHLDRITHIMMQGSHLSYHMETPYVLTGRKGNEFVQQLWAHLGFDSEHVIYNTGDQSPTSARRMIFSCRAVLVHPWLSLRTLEVFGINPSQPSSTRNKVMYMTRSNGRTVNGGRRVVNEDELLDSIRGLLIDRDRGEELVIFDPEKFHNSTELFSWFQQNVAAVVGPHGGAMLHHRWAAKGTLVIEMMPTTFTSVMVFEEASVLSQNYAAIVVPPTSPTGTDMRIDVEDVLTLLRRYLGVKGEDPLRKSYPWKAKELGLDVV